ncbi:predicted protein [Chaetomium globosum CBS 148.51]|uniref:Uncharacterized protein n=1 Tax=Chaetomium globosum (strain ATCC 6205 / CBS 148.51 / DSM 1962 / NBRC 6347 / NRRL 1970) TaxID=306901 RepID=Q2GSM3_CHAGB|nr:uncharacterized protein CHGG_09031 [Chaetomium globosum CBS 148.51]EAQ85017.1 predicted protein [Chaetomium globosum CBS 148.51]
MEAKEFTTTSYSFKCLKCVPNTNASPVTVRQRNVHRNSRMVRARSFLWRHHTRATHRFHSKRLRRSLRRRHRRAGPQRSGSDCSNRGGLRQSLILSRI